MIEYFVTSFACSMESVLFVTVIRTDEVTCLYVLCRALEVAVEGKKQGVTKKVALSSACQLFICKKELLRQFVNVILSIPDPALHLHTILKLSDVTEIEQCLVNMPYRQLKNLSDDYTQAWNTVRVSCFPSWTVKSESLQCFSLAD
jgi:hypothetical protein